MTIVPADEMEKYIGQEVGVSDWFEINQERINQFAEGTNDHQFIHVDEELAKSTPWGSKASQETLTLSWLSSILDCPLALLLINLHRQWQSQVMHVLEVVIIH